MSLCFCCLSDLSVVSKVEKMQKKGSLASGVKKEIPLKAEIFQRLRGCGEKVWLKNVFSKEEDSTKVTQKAVAVQCDQMAKSFQSMWLFTTMKTWQIAKHFCQSKDNILPNTKKTLKKLPNSFIIVPKWRNFAKSGHTAASVGRQLLDNPKVVLHTRIFDTIFGMGSVWPDRAICWTLGKFLKPMATINLHKFLTFMGNFWCQNLSFLGNLFYTFGDF